MCPIPSSSDATAGDTAPLDETEITRLIAAARTESYRPSEAARRSPVEDFRPKSLLELARLRREAEKAALPTDLVEGADETPTDTAFVSISEGDGFAPTADPAADAGGFGSRVPGASSHPSQTAAVMGAADLSAGAAESWPLADERITEPERAAAAALGKADLSAAGPQPTNAEALERIRSEAYAAGRAAAEAEARAGLSAATEVLEAAAQALLHPATGAMAGLRAEITEAVLRLASERAGVEIDTIPDAFVERIEALADRIHSRAIQPVLRLHPDDLAAIEPFIAGSDSLAAMRILATEELLRGDVDLTVEGLRLSDRILGQPAARKGTRAAPKPMPGN